MPKDVSKKELIERHEQLVRACREIITQLAHALDPRPPPENEAEYMAQLNEDARRLGDKDWLCPLCNERHETK